MKKITVPQLKEIIAQEINSTLQEAVDHEAIREVVNGASKLLAAVEAFKEVASPSMVNALTPQINQIEKTLERMVSNPGAYIQKKKPLAKNVLPKKVTLKPQKSEKLL